MSTKETTDVGSQSGGSGRSTSRIPPPGRVPLPRAVKTRSSSLKDIRVATRRAPSGEKVDEPKPEMETTSVPGPSTLIKDLLREQPQREEVTAAPSGGVQAVDPVPGDNIRPSRTFDLTDVSNLCIEIINQRMDIYLADIREYVIEMIAQASDHANAELPKQVSEVIDQVMETQKVKWEVPNSLTRSALVTLQDRVDDNSGHLIAKIDNLEKELEAMKAEVATCKSNQVIGGQPISGSDSETRKLKREKRRRRRKRKSSRERSSDSSSDDDSPSSSSSSDSDRGSRRRRALRKTLTELNPSNRRFARVLSYKNYRLHDRNSSERGKIRRRVASWTKRMTTSVGKFSGADPISVLQFLAKFKIAADNNGIPEGGAKLVLRNFLTGRAAEAYDASLYVDALGMETMGIQHWPDAVHWLLQTYAKDSHIRDVVTRIRDLKQKDQETEYDFGHRVLATYSRIPGVYTQADQVVTFIEGLHEAVSAGVNRDRQVAPNSYETIHSVMDLANSHGIVERARSAQLGKLKPIRRNVMLVEPDNPTNSSGHSTSVASGYADHPAALAIENQESLSMPSTPSFSTYTPSERTPTSHVTTDIGSASQAAALAIVPNRNPRLADDAQPYRPGWIDRRPRQPTMLRNPQSENYPQVGTTDQRRCFFCASLSHYVPDCPFVTEAVRIEARRNLMEATPAQRALLPNWTFTVAGVPNPRNENYGNNPNPVNTDLSQEKARGT